MDELWGTFRYGLHPGKLTWQWKITNFLYRFVTFVHFQMVVFSFDSHCYASFPRRF